VPNAWDGIGCNEASVHIPYGDSVHYDVSRAVVVGSVVQELV
jgi:hypothetical protein